MQAIPQQRRTTRLPMVIFIAWRNIWRNPARSLLTILALGGSLVMMLLYAALIEGMTRQMVEYATELSTSHLQIHREAFIDNQDLYATLPWSHLEKIEQALPNITVAPRLYAAGLASVGENSSSAIIKAIDPHREADVTQLLSHLREGRASLGQTHVDDDPLPRYNLLIGNQMAKRMGIKPGAELILVTQAVDGSIGNGLFRVAGILRPIEPGFDRMGILMSIEAYQQLMYLEQGVHELAIKLESMDTLEQTQSSLNHLLIQLSSEQPMDPFGGPPRVRNWKQLTPTIAEMLEMSNTMMMIIGFIIIGLASLGMVNTLLMAIHERTHEFGILLSIGMSRWWLLLMVLLESLFLALISALLGTLVATLLCGYLEAHGIDFSESMPDGYDWGGIQFEPVMQVHLEPQQILSTVLLLFVITLVAALIPSWRTVRMRPAEVLR